MSKKEFVIRGQTASGETETLNFGMKDGYAYRLVDFRLFPSTAVGASTFELIASITAAKTYEDPENPNFNNEGLIGTAVLAGSSSYDLQPGYSVVNDMFLITQNLILAVVDTKAGSPMAVNWQCRFVAEKMSESDKATQNYRQFMIFDE